MTYWEQRALDSIGRMESAVNGALPELVKSFEDTRQELQKEIDAFYGRYARNNAVTLEEAQKVLSLSELREFKGNLKNYEKLARDSIGTFNLQVDNLSVKARITRLQALETQCDAVLQKLYQAQRRLVERTATDVFTEEYYRSQFAIEQYTGFQFQFSAPATAVIQRVLKEPVQGADISTRLWRQDIDTGFRIRQTLNQMFITGKPPQYFAEELQKAIGAVRTNPDGTPGGTGKKYEAYRLLYNESAYASGQANLESYKADGLDEYEIIATLDFKTSDICREQDSKHYPVDQAVTGETFPPFHVNCRTTTAPYIPDLKNIKSTRMARDPETGKSVRVEKQSYEKWREGLSARMGQDKLATAEKMARNESADFSQYQEYKAVLGKDAPKSFASFQNLKYNNSEEYRLTKYDYYLRNRLAGHPELSLRNADRLDIDERKYTGYLFNPDNPKGYAKGKAITSRLGYDISNYAALDKLVKENIVKYPSSVKAKTQHGQKYEVNMIVRGLKGKQAKLQVGLIYDNGSDVPRLTSVYIDELKEGNFKNG